MKFRYVVKKFLRQSGLLGASAVIVASATFAGIVNIAQPGGANAMLTPFDGGGGTPTPTCFATDNRSCPTDTTDTNKPKVDCQEVFNSSCHPPKTTTTKTTTAVKTTQPSTSGCTPQDQYPNTNIIYCGLTGSTGTELMNSFKGYYKNNNDGHGHTDLQTVYNAAGFKSSMFTSGSWHYGIAYNDGTIAVAGKVVGTNAQIASRCFSGMSNCQPTYRYKHLASNVYTRDATWFFDKNSTSKLTLVHYNSDGVADFAMWKGCGNVLIFKPKTYPKPVLACVSLTHDTGVETDSTLTYVFTATATEKDQTNGKMLINFGDGSNSKTVNIDKSTVTFSEKHVYNKTDVTQKLTAQIMIGVNGLAKSDNPDCAKSIVIAPKTSRSLACVDLKANPQDSAKTKYTFTATARTNNATIQYYTFNYGDGTSDKVTTDKTVATTTKVHTFAPGSHTVKATVTGSVAGDNSGCVVSFKVTTPPPKQLTNTGPGSVIGIFGLTTIIGTALHQFALRRKFNI